MKWLISKEALMLLGVALGTIMVVNRTRLAGIVKAKA